ncbi:hypothetical protein Tco_0756254 [Tanacetum coccineum]
MVLNKTTRTLRGGAFTAKRTLCANKTNKRTPGGGDGVVMMRVVMVTAVGWIEARSGCSGIGDCWPELVGKLVGKEGRRKPYERGEEWLDVTNGVIDSGCSRHMTRNISYLTDYEEIDRGYVAFGGNPKGGKITSKLNIPRILARKSLDSDSVKGESVVAWTRLKDVSIQLTWQY